MPRAKTEKIVSDGAEFQTVEIEVGERGTTKTAQYVRPVTAAVLLDMLMGHGDEVADYAAFFPGTDQKNETETVSEFVRRMFVSALDKKARADVYESLAQESTFITVGKERVNVMNYKLPKLVVAINGMRSQVEVRDAAGTDESRKAAEKSVGYGPWKTAARKLCEGYTDDNGVAVKPLAQENPASGMLEMLPA